MAKNVVVSLSGGMDSSTLLLRCLSDYDNVTALSFDYGQKHRVELERAQSLVDYLNTNGKKVTYQVIKLEPCRRWRRCTRRSLRRRKYDSYCST